VSTRIQPDIGTDFVGYRIEELIGRGGMGVVYRAYDLRLKRVVALKLVAPERALDERFRARFARETELAMTLEHPNVVPIYDAGDVDGRLYLAMRLVDGSDLRTLLRAEGQPLPAQRAFAICRQVGSALDAAHAKGLVHRDVKPSNILVAADDHVYVADLGLGRRVDESPDDEPLGTPAYVAPEQIEGLPVDARTDIYALGCLFFECLTGAPPFARDSKLALGWAHLEEEPPRASTSNPDLPAAIDNVLKRALAKAPADRYSSCGDLMRDAQQALGLGRGTDTRRRRFLLGAAVVLAVLLAAAITAGAVLRGRGAASPLQVRPNTLVRIDPTTNEITDVIGVDRLPNATAVGGGSIWVYNQDSRSLSEVDPKAKAVRRTIAVASSPDPVGVPRGPVLAADAHGAWLVGVGYNGVGFLTNVRPGIPGDRRLRLGFQPSGVAVGEGSVWVVGDDGARGELVRIDPDRLAVSTRKVYPRPVILDSVATGYGAVWAVDAVRERLYRIDPRRLELSRGVVVGPSPGRPWAAFDDIWIEYDGDGAKGMLVNPVSLTNDLNLSCCAPRDGSDTAAFGSTWTVNWPSGTVVRWDGQTKEPVGDIHVTGAPQFGAPCMTSIAAGAGAVWVTVAPPSVLPCSA
jgi:tRNA A-37 threonylcarbamoyl transferase component Bud32